MKPIMSAVCVRYDPRGLPADQVAHLHHEVTRRIQDGGQFWISTTMLKGRWWFRINPVNFRTLEVHMDRLLALLRRECEAAAALGAGSGRV